MAWKIEPTNKKSIVDTEFFRKHLKNGKTLVFSREVGYRWGYVIVEDDPTDMIKEALANNEPLRVTSLDVSDHSFEDGCWTDNIGIDKLPKKEQKLLEEFIWPEDAGWEFVDNETYIHGEVTVTAEG